MRVCGSSQVGNLAGAIAGTIRTGQAASLNFIGAAAGYQAVKAIAIAAKFLKEESIIPTVTVHTKTNKIDGADRTIYVLEVRGVKEK